MGMLYTITGVLSEKLTDGVVLESGGLGYYVRTTPSDADQLPLGEQVKLYVYENIKEDAHDLYGFTNIHAKQFFEQLISVSGVGPKAGLAIIAAVGVEGAQSAIANENAAILTSAPGIGKKGAERIIVELKNKVFSVPGVQLGGGVATDDAAFEALQSLGYSAAQAQATLQKLPKEITDDEARIKAALKELGR